MKKLLLLLTLVGFITTTKAQDFRSNYKSSSPEIKLDTAVTALTGKPGDLEQLRNDQFAKALTKDALRNTYLEKLKERPVYDDTVYSTMPVVGGTRVSKMPVVRPGIGDTHYAMLVKKIDIVDPTKSKTPVGTAVRP